MYINCNTSYCDTKCKDGVLNSNCVILEDTTCLPQNCNICTNGMNLNEYAIYLCKELKDLRITLKCMTDIFCPTITCQINTSNIIITNN